MSSTAIIDKEIEFNSSESTIKEKESQVDHSLFDADELFDKTIEQLSVIQI